MCSTCCTSCSASPRSALDLALGHSRCFPSYAIYASLAVVSFSLGEVEALKSKIWNIVFIILILAGFVIFAYRGQIAERLNGSQVFDLTKVPLKDMLGYRAFVEPGPQGFVIFYSDLEGCSTCLGKIGLIKAVSENYPDIGYYAILKERENRERFGDLMAEYKYPGEHLHDPDHNLQKQMGLSDHPQLMFFNRFGKLVATMPLDVDQDQLLRIIYQYVEEL